MSGINCFQLTDWVDMSVINGFNLTDGVDISVFNCFHLTGRLDISVNNCFQWKLSTSQIGWTYQLSTVSTSLMGLICQLVTV